MASKTFVSLIEALIAYAPHDRLRDIQYTTRIVIGIGGQLLDCLAANDRQHYKQTYELDSAVNKMIMVSAEDP